MLYYRFKLCVSAQSLSPAQPCGVEGLCGVFLFLFPPHPSFRSRNDALSQGRGLVPSFHSHKSTNLPYPSKAPHITPKPYFAIAKYLWHFTSHSFRLQCSAGILPAGFCSCMVPLAICRPWFVITTCLWHFARRCLQWQGIASILPDTTYNAALPPAFFQT